VQNLLQSQKEGRFLQKMAVIEPNAFTARMMSFVLAAAIATALALVFAVSNMFPLSKTQVFLLNTRRAENQIIEIKPLPINDRTMEVYKESFIKEYIRARNEIIPNVNVMRFKWRSPDGPVYIWSSRNVYAGFMGTMLWSAFMKDSPEVMFSCPVEFQRIEPRGVNRYAVKFRWFCTSDSAGQTTAKDYTIVIGLTGAAEVKWGARMENPLGLQVSEYEIESGNGDPLDFAP
jgi:type IV secretory pathway component VirB8